jgi:rhamnose utilization protein RhaD (predicted bifunctional aldolase and dehydrogenase)
MSLQYLADLWDESHARTLDPPALLRYRSNLLGSDLRITNFGGGNTSSKLDEADPLDGQKKPVLWVKGSGGDLGSIKVEGFATLYLDKVLALARIYRGVELEDEMVGMYPLCTFGNNPVAASIDTALHAFLPFPHVDHLHPDWGIALAASANGKEKMDEFNHQFGHKMVWIPWQRPGFELAMMLERAVKAVPGCDGVVLGGFVSQYHHHHRSDRPVHREPSRPEKQQILWRRQARSAPGTAKDCQPVDAFPAR